MDEEAANPAVPESPKPLAFTIDFGNSKNVATQRQKALAEKFRKRHKRGQSLSKIEDTSTTPSSTQHPLTGNLPRKSSFQSEGYFSSDDVKSATVKSSVKRSDLTLLLKNVTSDRMSQSFPSVNLPSIVSPEELELKDVSSPELDLLSPYSPKDKVKKQQYSNTECEKLYIGNNNDEIFVDGADFDFDKSDDASDTGTYTLDADNYSAEQKARMSIDREFKIEQVSVQKKTEEYINSLASVRDHVLGHNSEDSFRSPKSPTIKKIDRLVSSQKLLSPIMSPTQNLSITRQETPLNNGENDLQNKTFTKIMFPSSEVKKQGIDQGSVISVTSSGAFKPKPEKKLERKYSLTKSEVQVQAYIADTEVATKTSSKLTANIVNVQNIEVKNVSPSLPPAIGGYSGKTSPSKIPSPIHTLSRPRSSTDQSLDTELILQPTQNFINSLQQRLSLDSDPDSDYDVKYGLQLNNTAHLLKQKASHTRHNSLDDRTMNISNKLEHFQNKNFQGIDQTFSNLFNQYSHNKVMHKIQNSPNNSPIKRSSSFSTKNQINSPKNTNVVMPQKETNIYNSPAMARNTSIQRSSSTASIKPNYASIRRSSISDHRKIDRTQFGDTESSSEEDFDKNIQKRKDLSNITNTRCNRAFSLRRARVDNEPLQPLRCPNTPEMRRKSFQPEAKQERAISVDRKPMKTNDIQSRYLLNVTKRATPPPSAKSEAKVLKTNSAGKANTNRMPPVFSRTDSGRFSVRSNGKPPAVNSKGPRKDGSVKKQGGGSGGGARSNSSLSSREVEFQNWKRRKSYDPMKAAAEGKKKEIAAKRQSLGPAATLVCHNAAVLMTRSAYGAAEDRSQESSPSRSSSVHRSQSFHGTAALEQLLSSEEEDDLTLSADEGFSPPTPSPCELSPARASLRHTLWERIRH